MGVCSSCMRGRRLSSTDDADSRLLFDDPHTINYGSFGDQNPPALQADPQDLQREEQALQKIVAQTSNYLVDIFAMVPQNIQRSPSTFSGKDARLLQYQDVMASVSSSSKTDPSLDSSAAHATQEATDWLSDDDEDEALKSYKINRPEDGGPLVGGFADVGTAMK